MQVYVKVHFTLAKALIKASLNVNVPWRLFFCNGLFEAVLQVIILQSAGQAHTPFHSAEQNMKTQLEWKNICRNEFLLENRVLS